MITFANGVAGASPPMKLAPFTTQAIVEFSSTAAIAPSSRYLAQAMAAPLGLERCSTVIEFGPGTGAMTRELLRRMRPDARLYAFEINPSFCRHLSELFDDPRLEIIPSGAQRAPEELARRGLARVDAALSSLGLSLMDDALQHEIIASAAGLLSPRGRFTQFQYVVRTRMQGLIPRHFSIQPLLESYFRDVSRRVIYRNFPPSFVYSCGSA